MGTVKFFELLANTIHQTKAINELLDGQPDVIKQALLNNDSGLLKAQFNSTYIANPSHVVQA